MKFEIEVPDHWVKIWTLVDNAEVIAQEQQDEPMSKRTMELCDLIFDDVGALARQSFVAEMNGNYGRCHIDPEGPLDDVHGEKADG